MAAASTWRRINSTGRSGPAVAENELQSPDQPGRELLRVPPVGSLPVAKRIRGIRMNGVGDVGECKPILHCQRIFRNHLSRVYAEDRCSENLTAVVRQHLHHSVGLTL